MSRWVWLLLGAVVINVTACNRHPATTQAVQPHKTPVLSAPHRKPGFWAQRVSGPAGDQASWLCIDEATDPKVSWQASRVDPVHCPETMLQKPGGMWAFEAACDRGEAGHEQASGLVSGDFAKAYHVEATSTVTGAKGPLVNGVRHFTLDAEWQGPCPAGLKPGVLRTSGGDVDLLDIK